MTQDDLIAISDGVRGPFWQLFKQHAEAEWGTGGRRFEDAVLKAASKDEAQGHLYLQMVVFAREEIRRLMRWPEEQATEARAAAAPQRPDALAAQAVSRRGPGM